MTEMNDTEGAGRAEGGEPGGDGAESETDVSWSRRLREMDGSDGGAGSGAGSPDRGRVSGELRDLPPTPAEDGLLDEGLEQLREDARDAARDDAGRQRPDPDGDVSTERETSLRERCRALYERWKRSERRRIRDLLTGREERASRLLSKASLLLDRYERMINDLIRLKARRSAHRRQAESTREEDGGREDGLSTKVYVAAISFLGLVEFFANAPVFSTLLPRDPLTERQINVIMETSTGWLAGVERVLAQLVLRPDAALLAAGVITFLCVLAHFFGHSLRELIMKKDGQSRAGSVGSRSAMENVVPMVLTGLGLALVLGVLFQARVILGDVGEERYQQDMEAVSELRREAGWLRSDGDLLEANQLEDRADDMEEAATRLREYAASMSRMTFPILLLNLTLVLAAITAAYFHRQERSGEHLASPYEDDRKAIVEAAESTASDISDVLSSAVRPIREMRNFAEDGYSRDPEGVVRRLESIVALYQRENARARGLAPEDVAAFRGSVELGLEVDGDEMNASSFERAADQAKAEHEELSRRFREARDRFNEQLGSWEADGENG